MLLMRQAVGKLATSCWRTAHPPHSPIGFDTYQHPNMQEALHPISSRYRLSTTWRSRICFSWNPGLTVINFSFLLPLLFLQTQCQVRSIRHCCPAFEPQPWRELSQFTVSSYRLRIVPAGTWSAHAVDLNSGGDIFTETFHCFSHSYQANWG
jgi:hypothetical protein